MAGVNLQKVVIIFNSVYKKLLKQKLKGNTLKFHACCHWNLFYLFIFFLNAINVISKTAQIFYRYQIKVLALHLQICCH